MKRPRLWYHRAEFCLSALQLELGTLLSQTANTILCFSLVEYELIRRRSLKIEEREREGWKMQLDSVCPCCQVCAGVAVQVSVLQVLLCASNQNSSIVECWSLRKEGLPVNNIFQQISPVGEFLHQILFKRGAWPK